MPVPPGVDRAEDFLARFDRRDRAKCDPKRGWERGAGGKCVRVKPPKDLPQSTKTALVGGASFVGGGLLMGAVVLARQAGASKQKAADLSDRATQTATAVTKSDATLQRLEQKLLPAAKGQPFDPPKDNPPKPPATPPDRTLDLERGLGEAQQENRDLKIERDRLRSEREGLRSRLSESEKAIASQQDNLRKARQELDDLGSAHSQQVSQAGELQKTIAQQEKALASIAQELERKSAKLARANAKLQQEDQERSRAVIQQRATALENERLKSRQSDLEEDLTNTNFRLKQATNDLAQARRDLDTTTKTLGKTQKDLAKARDRVKNLEDALLVAPIRHPSGRGRKPEQIDPDVLDQQPDGAEKRRRHTNASIERAKLHLAKLRGEPDKSRRSLLQTPIDALKNQQGEFDPERVDIAKRALGKAKQKFQESQAEPPAPASKQEAQSLLEAVVKGRVKEKGRAAIPGAIEVAIPGPNGKRLADLYRFAKADAGLANKVETWSKEMEVAMQDPNPVTRREWLKQFSEKLAKETFSTQSNQDKVFEAIDETGEAITDKYANRGRIGGESVRQERSLIDQIFSPEFEAGGRSRKLPKGTRAVKKSWLERIARPGSSRYKEVADVKRRRSALAKIARGLLDLQNDRLDSDQLDSRSLAQILRCDSASSWELLQGDRTLTAREIGTLRAIYNLPAIFDPDDHLSTQILLSGIRQDARTCKAPWKGVLGKCRREQGDDRPPPNPGRTAAKATLLAGGLVGAGLLGVAAYGATRPMPPRPEPPNIGPGRPRPPAPPTKPPARSAAPKPAPAPEPIADPDSVFSPKPKAVIDQAWQHKNNAAGSVADPTEILRSMGKGGNRSDTFNKFNAGLIGKNLSDENWQKIVAWRRSSKKEELKPGIVAAIASIGSGTDAEKRVQSQLWDAVIEAKKPLGGFPRTQELVSSLAREARYAASKDPHVNIDDAWLQRHSQIAYIDAHIETELRSTEAVKSVGSSPKDWESALPSDRIGQITRYPFLRNTDFTGDKNKSLGSKISAPSFAYLSDWQKIKYDTSDPYNKLVRDMVLDRAGRVNASNASTALSNEKFRSSFAEDALFLISQKRQKIPAEQARASLQARQEERVRRERGN